MAPDTVSQPGADPPQGSPQPDDPGRSATAVLARISETILGDPVGLTREQVAAAAGVTVEQARTYWRAMGFADVGPRRAFTATDAAMLRLLVGWVESGRMERNRAVEIVRSMGQSTSRLAEWQAASMVRAIAEADRPTDLNEVADGLAELLPGLEELLVHAWRRNLAAVVGRVLAGADLAQADAETGVATVGFADIAGFTRLGRTLPEGELAAMVESFEVGAADLVAGHGGRLVKTLGDEVMFVSEDADAAVAIAAALPRLASPDQAGPRLRIGLATGRLVALMGDYYGETVNRASRLTAVARPGATLMDPATEEAMTTLDPYHVRHLRPRALRGLGLVRVASVAPRDV